MRIGKEPNATENFERAKKKFKRGIVWKVSKVSLAKQNSKHLGCSCKVLIDMNTSTFQPVLQSTVKMPTQATPRNEHGYEYELEYALVIFGSPRECYRASDQWQVSKDFLAKQNCKHLGCTCKVLTDMNTSIFQPVLQSTVKMPTLANSLIRTDGGACCHALQH